MNRRLVRSASFWFLLFLGLGLLIWGLERAAAPHPCVAGNDFYRMDLFTQAEKEYLKVLAADPESSCAAQGLQIVQVERCRLALRVPDSAEEAKKAVLASEVKDYGPICAQSSGELFAAQLEAGPLWHWTFNDLAWVLIVVGGALLFPARFDSSFRKGKPGSLQVTELVDATGLDKIQTKAYTAQLRERLGSSGVLPLAPVPGGSLQESVIDAISTSPLSHASWGREGDRGSVQGGLGK